MSSSGQKLVLSLLFSCSFFLKMGAQAALILLFFGNKLAREDLHLSLDAGINISSIENLDGNMRIGPNFGLGLHVQLADRIFFVPEFKALSSRGKKNVKNPVFDLPPDIQNLQVTSQESYLRLNYLDLPLLIQYRLEKHFYFSTGFQFSFLGKANYQTNVMLANGNEIQLRQDVKSELNPVDLGIPLEIGYVIFKPVDGKGMDIRLRYTLGLSDVMDSNTFGKTRNTNFQVIATFPIVYTNEDAKP